MDDCTATNFGCIDDVVDKLIPIADGLPADGRSSTGMRSYSETFDKYADQLCWTENAGNTCPVLEMQLETKGKGIRAGLANLAAQPS